MVKKRFVSYADPRPVKMRPINSSAIFDAVAMKSHPMTHGIAANLIVFKRPSHSIKIAAIKQPTGTASTITDAIHDVCSFVSLKQSLFGAQVSENEKISMVGR